MFWLILIGCSSPTILIHWEDVLNGVQQPSLAKGASQALRAKTGCQNV